MTEEEAKTKWCPFVRLGSSKYPGYSLNREVDGARVFPTPSRCLASDCTAWRWKFRQTNKQTGHSVWPAPEPIYEQTDQGYCGLSGALWP